MPCLSSDHLARVWSNTPAWCACGACTVLRGAGTLCQAWQRMACDFFYGVVQEDLFELPNWSMPLDLLPHRWNGLTQWGPHLTWRGVEI